jgi:hypothetical protein
MRSNDRWALVLGIAAVGNLANGIWMLIDPESWYWRLPAAVPDTGPLNDHFVRDIGAAFTAMSAAMLVAVVRPALRVTLISLVSLFYLLHAAIHVHDTLRGLLPSSHWLIDFPGVYLPAIILVACVAALARTQPAGT